MGRNPAQKKTERLNLSLTREDRDELEKIAKREDRDLSYIAAWFTHWGIQQYQEVGSLIELKLARLSTPLLRVLETELDKSAARRVRLRAEEGREFGDRLGAIANRDKKASGG